MMCICNSICSKDVNSALSTNRQASIASVSCFYSPTKPVNFQLDKKLYIHIESFLKSGEKDQCCNGKRIF